MKRVCVVGLIVEDQPVAATLPERARLVMFVKGFSVDRPAIKGAFATVDFPDHERNGLDGRCPSVAERSPRPADGYPGTMKDSEVAGSTDAASKSCGDRNCDGCWRGRRVARSAAQGTAPADDSRSRARRREPPGAIARKRRHACPQLPRPSPSLCRRHAADGHDSAARRIAVPAGRVVGRIRVGRRRMDRSASHRRHRTRSGDQGRGPDDPARWPSGDVQPEV